MKKIILKYIILGLIVISSSTLCHAQGALPFTIDAQNSNITFKANSTLHPFEGKINEFSGDASFDGSFPGLIVLDDIKINISSVLTDNNGINNNMKRMFEAEKFPYAYCHVVSLSAGQLTLDKTVMGKLSAELTIRDKTVPFDENVSVKKDNDGFIVIGSTTISLKAFELKPPTFLFLIKVSDLVRVDFSIKFKRK